MLLPNLQTNYTKDIEGKVELGRAVGLACDVPIQSQLGFRTLFCLHLLPEMPMIDRASSALSLLFLSRLLLIHVHPNISMQVLHTVLYTFHILLPRRIHLLIKSFLSLQSLPSFSWPWYLIQGWYYWKKWQFSIAVLCLN